MSTEHQGTNRRRFLQSMTTSTLSLVAASGLSSKVWASATSGGDKLKLGFIGVGGRGNALLRGFLERADCEAVVICDPNRDRLAQTRDAVISDSGKSLQVTTNYEEVLSDDKIDAVVIATPDHWHAPATIYACQAGKHVYVEKPVCNRVWEGQKAVEAARSYDRVVQGGTQSRSAPYSLAAREYIRSGKLGDIVLCNVFNQKPDMNPIHAQEDSAPPDFLDWDLWNGPCENTQFNWTRFSHWNAHWDYGGGEVTNDGVHQLDLACMALDIEELPMSVYSSGYRREGNDAEVPDTIATTFKFDGLRFPIVFQQTLEGNYMLKTDSTVRESDMFPYWQQNSTRIEIYGTKGVMFLGRHGGGWQVFARPHSRQPVVAAEQYGRFPDPEHKEDFVSAIREGRKPNGDIELGYRSATLCHLANLSYRVGNEHLKLNPETAELLNNGEAQILMRGSYREPYMIPEKV